MRIPPAEVVDTWPAPNYVDGEHRGPALVITEAIFLPIAMLSLLSRIYVRTCLGPKFGLDDWLMCASMLFVVAVTICVILATELYGWGMHMWDLRPHEAIEGRKVSIAVQALYLIASGLVKMSLLVSYLRFAPLDSWFRWLTKCTMGLVGTWVLIFFILLWAQCKPTNAYWDLVRSSQCIDDAPPLVCQSVIMVATDFLVCVLPLPTLMRHPLPATQRAALLIVFSLGFMVVIAGGLRTGWLYKVVYETYDVTWDGFMVWTWTAVEVNLAVICGCVPTLRPLFRKLFGSEGGQNSIETIVNDHNEWLSRSWFRRREREWDERCRQLTHDVAAIS